MSGLRREKKSKTITPGLLNSQKSLILKFHSQPELKGEPQMLQGEGHVLSSRKTQRDGMGREEGSGWGTHVYLWWIHFDIWQN